MQLHVFNPEHDMALAHGDAHFTPPRAGRQMRHDLGFLPLVWAGSDDVVLVDDRLFAIGAANSSLQPMGCGGQQATCVNNQATYGPQPARLANYPGQLANYPSHLANYPSHLANCPSQLVTLSDLAALPISAVCPWGWDAALVLRLTRAGVARHLMPADGQLAAIRRLSSRHTAAALLPHLVGLAPDRLTGEAWVAHTEDELAALIDGHPAHEAFILKAPWSCSGRGLRQVGRTPTGSERGWARNIIGQQGSLMVEPRYERLFDFGMEFESDGRQVGYRGLSLFGTANGAYTGNLLATEQEKTRLLARHTDAALLATVRENIVKGLTPLLRNIYVGPLGVDMMLTATADGPRIHPMVEINLRRTMGHVAIDMASRMEQPHGTMQIACAEGRHTLRIGP